MNRAAAHAALDALLDAIEAPEAKADERTHQRPRRRPTPPAPANPPSDLTRARARRVLRERGWVPK